MIYFSDKLKLRNLFEKYCKENRISVSPFNMTTWLYSLGLLNEEKVKEVLRNE